MLEPINLHDLLDMEFSKSNIWTKKGLVDCYVDLIHNAYLYLTPWVLG